MSYNKVGLFTALKNYSKNIFRRPNTPLTSRQLRSTYWGKIFSIPMVGLLWLLSKLPLIGPRVEKQYAQKVSKKWFFKPIPDIKTLSESAIQYKHQKIIHINQKFDIESKILDFTTFNEIVEKFPFAQVRECGCRSMVRQCDSPKLTCLSLKWAQDVSQKIENHSDHRIPKESELAKIIDIADEYALVHMALHHPDMDHIYTICNCCDCCCIAFREFVAHAIPLFAGSKFVAKIDENKCDGCNYCINFRCRFRAILKVNEDGTIIDTRKEDKENFKFKWPLWSENRKGWEKRIRRDPPSWRTVKKQHSRRWFARIDSNRCFGCGNCASPKFGCPRGAIQLYSREPNYYYY